MCRYIRYKKTQELSLDLVTSNALHLFCETIEDDDLPPVYIIENISPTILLNPGF